MVTTRTTTIRRNLLKVQRLLERLAQLGIVKGSLADTEFYFIGPKRRHVTQNSSWTVDCNPHAIVYEREHDGVSKIIAMGCVHDVCERCITCDVHPDADVKILTNRAKLRARAINILWETDPYVNPTMIHKTKIASDSNSRRGPLRMQR